MRSDPCRERPRDAPDLAGRRGAGLTGSGAGAAASFSLQPGEERPAGGPPGRFERKPGEEVRRGLRRLFLIGIAIIVVFCIAIAIAIALLFGL